MPLRVAWPQPVHGRVGRVITATSPWTWYSAVIACPLVGMENGRAFDSRESRRGCQPGLSRLGQVWPRRIARRTLWRVFRSLWRRVTLPLALWFKKIQRQNPVSCTSLPTMADLSCRSGRRGRRRDPLCRPPEPDPPEPRRFTPTPSKLSPIRLTPGARTATSAARGCSGYGSRA